MPEPQSSGSIGVVADLVEYPSNGATGGGYLARPEEGAGLGLVRDAAQPDWDKMTAAVEGHYAANDEFLDPEYAHRLEEQLKDLGKDVRMFVYPGTSHAFFNDTR